MRKKLGVLEEDKKPIAKGDSMAISRMKNGTWRLEIYRPDAPRIRKVFKTRQEARKYETIFRGEIEKGNPDILDTFNKVLKG